MDDLNGTEETIVEAVEPTGPAEDQGKETATPEGGVNPHWEPLRSKLDPISFSKIEEDLKNWDKSADTRISSVNQQLRAYSELGTPEQLQSYATLAQRIDSEPEVIHKALGEFLQKTGRMPETQKELQAAVDNVEEEAEKPEENPELAELRAGQEQITQFLQAQAQAQQEAEADAALDTEIKQLKETHPELLDEDIQEVLQRAAFIASSSNKVPKLADVATDYIENVRNRILNTPRPGDSAPRLVPPTGGAPSTNAQQWDSGKASRDEIQNLIAGLVTRDRK